MNKEYICYVGIYNSKIGFLLEDDNKNNKFYNSFENLIKDIDNIYFQLDSKSIPALSEFEIIFQFKIKKKVSSGGSDSSLNIDKKTYSKEVIITNKSKKYVQELEEKLRLDDKKVKYSIAIDDGEPVKQTLLVIFWLIFSMFLVVDSLADFVIDESMDFEEESKKIKAQVARAELKRGHNLESN